MALFSLERKKLWGDLTEAFQYSKGTGDWGKSWGETFMRLFSGRTGDNGFKLKESRVRLDTG